MHDDAPLERLRYFDGQLLTAADLDAEQRYFIDKSRRHNRLLHGWGVVCGLDVTVTGPDAIAISPGAALDACGNEIVVREESALVGLAAAMGTTVAVRYDEVTTGGRVQECFVVAVIDQPAEPWVVLAQIGFDPLAVDPAVRRPLSLDPC